MEKLFASVAVGALFCLTSVAALAQNNPLITVDENGAGSESFPGVPLIPLTGVLGKDTGPGGRLNALIYSLGTPSLLAGDLLLFEPGSGVLSEIIRFNAQDTQLAFYSTDAITDLADGTGPYMLYANVSIATEGINGITTYTPTVSQPGFVSGFGATYQIISLPILASVPTPEFGSVFSLGGLLAAGGVGLWLKRRRRDAPNP